MANYTVYGFAPGAFSVTPNGDLMLDPDWDSSTDRIRYEITDNRDTDNGDNDTNRFDGDATNNESGDDINQSAVKYDAAGNQLASGQVYLEESWTLTDGNGNSIILYKVEGGGVHSGWVADGPIIPGVAYTYAGPTNVDESNHPYYTDLDDQTYDPDQANSPQGGTRNDTIRSGAQDDTVHGNAGDDSIDGGGGDDDIYGGDGSDTIDGGSGNDYIAYGRGGDSVRGGDGDDIIDEDAGEPNYDYNDTIDAGAGNDSVYAGWGDDYIEGGSGHDELHGSEGDDTIFGDGGDDTIYGGDGLDSIDGGDGNDLIYAGSGDDTVSGGAGNDEIHGGDGNDVVGGGTGNDTLTGGQGDDTYVLSPTGIVTVTDFDTSDPDGNGIYTDQLDVSDLVNSHGNPVHAWDVDVSDDGFGNALLTFPGGEQLVLQGVSPAQMSSPQQRQAAGIPCFTAGTLIATARGVVPIETVQPGDYVQTRDNGLRPVRWVGRRHVDANMLARTPRLKPIHIAPGAFGNHRALRVSPQHALSLDVRDTSGRTRLVRAGHLARLGGGAIRVARGVQSVTYVHLLLETHDILLTEGLASESLYPGPWGLLALGPAAAHSISRLIPELATRGAGQAYGPTVHPVAVPRELPATVHGLKGAA